VGTNPGDYDVAHGLSSRAVGPKSDGLVQIESAYVPKAQHAFVHRSHSGRYGIVNSEEGYQNLRRFLFGDIEVTATLEGLPRSILEGEDDIFWQAELRLSVRGLPIVMAERLTAHHCPIQLTNEKPGSADLAVPLVTTFLDSTLRADTSKPMRYVLHVRLISLREKGGVFGFFDHIEQTADFDDILVVDAQTGPPIKVWAQWSSQIATPLRDYEPQGDPLTDEDPNAGTWLARVPLPPSGSFVGDDAAVVLTARGRS
jgi:hypothetical protein